MKYILSMLCLLVTSCATNNPCHRYCVEQGNQASGYFNGECTCYHQTQDVWSK